MKLDEGHRLTDEQLQELEERIREMYEEAAKELAKQCKKAFGHAPENFFHLGGVVSCNTGPDALALAYLNTAHKE